METFIVLFKNFITLLFNMNSIYQRLYDAINLTFSLLAFVFFDFFFIIFFLKSPLYTYFHLFIFSIKWLFHIDLSFYIFFRDLIIALECV